MAEFDLKAFINRPMGYCEHCRWRVDVDVDEGGILRQHKIPLRYGQDGPFVECPNSGKKSPIVGTWLTIGDLIFICHGLRAGS